MERERHIEQQRKFESRRRELIDQENGIRAREMELDTAINEAKSKGVRFVYLSLFKIRAYGYIFGFNYRESQMPESGPAQ